jgi:hypothetical protein
MRRGRPQSDRQLPSRRGSHRGGNINEQEIARRKTRCRQVGQARTTRVEGDYPVGSDGTTKTEVLLSRPGQRRDASPNAM